MSLLWQLTNRRWNYNGCVHECYSLQYPDGNKNNDENNNNIVNKLMMFTDVRRCIALAGKIIACTCQVLSTSQHCELTGPRGDKGISSNVPYRTYWRQSSKQHGAEITASSYFTANRCGFPMGDRMRGPLSSFKIEKYRQLLTNYGCFVCSKSVEMGIPIGWK